MTASLSIRLLPMLAGAGCVLIGSAMAGGADVVPANDLYALAVQAAVREYAKAPSAAGLDEIVVARRLIREWAALHRAQLEANWTNMEAGRGLDRIEPLE